MLIFYSEKFLTWIWRLPFGVNVNLNLSKPPEASPKGGFISLCIVGVSAMKIPKDTSKLKKHIALMCDRLNKGGKLDLSSQTGEPPVQQQ